jgi:glycogen debranching enzyme
MSVEPWELKEGVALGQPSGVITLLEGSSFCISGRSGDISAGTPQGYFSSDSRFLSSFELRLDGESLEPLTVAPLHPFEAVFAARARGRSGESDATVFVTRHRTIGDRMSDEISLQLFGQEPVHVRLSITVTSDFADLFEVKAGKSNDSGQFSRNFEAGVLTLKNVQEQWARSTIVSFSEVPRMEGDTAHFNLDLEPHEPWKLRVDVSSYIGDSNPNQLDLSDSIPAVDAARGAGLPRHFSAWRTSVPAVNSNYEPLVLAVRKSQDDLGSLRMFESRRALRPVVAAGSPWFMALFGRDSILTSWMSLMVDSNLAIGTLEALARHQGKEVVERTEEQPGRILHELRFGGVAAATLGQPAAPYYGSVDATPLFVMLLGELRRWGLAPELVEKLLPHADRALEWIDNYGDLDGDGYVEYQRTSPHGLENQGWKEATGSICFADGTAVRSPVALAEVQGYVYSAYLARMHFALEAGDHNLAARYQKKAADLRAAFNKDFWVEDGGYFAIALDADKKPANSMTSNIGHCLWTGIIDEDKAAIVAPKLVSEEMFSGWGIRTLSSSHVNYNPLGYHTGSVWPHDSVINAAGLMRYGFVEEAHKVVLALLDAASFDGWRLPELFSGISRSEVPAPVSYPTSCSPQAWSSATPLMALRILLRFDPNMSANKVFVSPALPRQIRRLHVERVPIRDQRVTIDVQGDNIEIDGLTDEIDVLHEPRVPTSSYGVPGALGT